MGKKLFEINLPIYLYRCQNVQAGRTLEITQRGVRYNPCPEGMCFCSKGEKKETDQCTEDDEGYGARRKEKEKWKATVHSCDCLLNIFYLFTFLPGNNNTAMHSGV